MKKAINILFINPSSMPQKEQELFLSKESILRVPSFSMPIGLMDLSAYLKENSENINTTILDLGKDLSKIFENRESTPSKTVRLFIESELEAVDFKPDIVGISILFSTAHNTSIIIAEMVKKKWPDTVIICGGNHATNLYKNLLKDPNIDYVLRGEGEISFTEFAKKIQNGEQNFDIIGIFNKSKLAKSHQDELSLMIEDLKNLPMPAYDLLDTDYYKKNLGGSLMFSRGCSFQCAFCASHTVHGRKLRFKTAERIMAELNLLIDKYNFDKIIIEDDLFAARKDLFLGIVDKLSSKLSKRENPINFFLPQGLSVAILDEEIIDAMIKIGINESSLAIESGSLHVQKYIIKKNVSLEKAKRILEYFRKKDFLIYVNFILGFPGETRELMQETIDFIKTLDVDWVYIFHALPLPGSEICNLLVSKGIINLDNFDWDGLRLGRRSFDTPEITAEELEKLVYDTNIECNFINNSNLKNGRYQRAIDILNRIIVGQYPFHIVGRYVQSLAYRGMGRISDAETELKECLEWIGKNPESKRLYERYKEKMPLLTSMMESQSPSC